MSRGDGLWLKKNLTTLLGECYSLRERAQRCYCYIVLHAQKVQKPSKGDNDIFCLHLWELWMPHLNHLSFCDRQTGSSKLPTTTAREQNRALGPQVHARYPHPEEYRKIISTIAFVGSAKIGHCGGRCLCLTRYKPPKV